MYQSCSTVITVRTEIASRLLPRLRTCTMQIFCVKCSLFIYIFICASLRCPDKISLSPGDSLTWRAFTISRIIRGWANYAKGSRYYHKIYYVLNIQRFKFPVTFLTAVILAWYALDNRLTVPCFSAHVNEILGQFDSGMTHIKLMMMYKYFGHLN